MLCAVTSVALEQTRQALERCLAQIDFGRALLCSDQDPGIASGSPIEWRRIEAIGTREAYSHFILKDLVHHVTLPHVLIVQWDGFVLDAACWQDEFVHYDYIGAVWPQFGDGHIVGNGGFSLRSARLLKATSNDRFSSEHPEDIAISRNWRAALEREGILFAPPDVARRFAFEREEPAIPTFGFHGLFNFPRVLGQTDCQRTIEILPDYLLTTRDGADLVVCLVNFGRARAAWKLAVRRIKLVQWSWREGKWLWRIIKMNIMRQKGTGNSAV